MFFYFSCSYAQQLNGFVYNEHMEPLPGVNIYLQSTNIGTSTNLDGHFIIKLKEGVNTIVFSVLLI